MGAKLTPIHQMLIFDENSKNELFEIESPTIRYEKGDKITVVDYLLGEEEDKSVEVTYTVTQIINKVHDIGVMYQETWVYVKKD